MTAPRGEFSSKLGFLMAAAGSAVGLGNIWGFPTQVAGNGGAAFLLVYLVMAFCLAYPALMAELIIGRHTKANPVKALRSIAGSRDRPYRCRNGLCRHNHVWSGSRLLRHSGRLDGVSRIGIGHRPRRHGKRLGMVREPQY